MQDKELLDDAGSNIGQVLRRARAISLPVIHSGLHFLAGYPELIGGKGGCARPSRAWERFKKIAGPAGFYPSLQPMQGGFVIQGCPGASAFAGSDLDVFLRDNGITELFPVGYALQPPARGPRQGLSAPSESRCQRSFYRHAAGARATGGGAPLPALHDHRRFLPHENTDHTLQQRERTGNGPKKQLL